tara:strand:+ start:299 stop:1858 length:1560 start_codon:yes stop_codon:yes gene_type:complete
MNKGIKDTILDNRESTPVEFAYALGSSFSKIKKLCDKKKIGQFFTPKEISEYLTNYISSNFYNQKELSLLDPGCGMAILSCAIVERIIKESKCIEKIAIELYEFDEDILPFTKLVIKHLNKWAKTKKVILRIKLINENYALKNLNSTNINTDGKFDIIISNPPYFKLSKKEKAPYLSNKLIYDQPNIYSIFLTISLNLLKKNGEIIFVTPRSFTSGKYFKKFREYFFERMIVSNIHVFESRNKAFKKDNVLQEIILFKGIKRNKDTDETIIITNSNGIFDIEKSNHIKCCESEMLDLNSIDKSLFIPTSIEDVSLLKTFSKWNYRLKDLKLKASTGPVVYFRNLDFLKENKVKNTVPFIWLNNVSSMELNWPNKKLEKKQYFKETKVSESVLVDMKNYVLVRRFSAKGDKKRLIASPLCKNRNDFEYKKVAIENKLNYIYNINRNLTKNEVIGLSALLTSSYYNKYFIMLSGNTNVSVTELNQITFPKLDKISEIGKQLIEIGFLDSNIEKEVGILFKN